MPAEAAPGIIARFEVLYEDPNGKYHLGKIAYTRSDQTVPSLLPKMKIHLAERIA